MLRYWVLTLFLLFRRSLQASDHNDNIFVTPPGPGPTLIYTGNPTWELNSNQTISWITNLTSYRIELWQQGLNPGYGYSISTVFDSSAAGTGGGSYSTSWNVQLYTSNLTFSPIYFFWLKPNSPEGFTSHYFNISAEAEQVVLSSNTATSSNSTGATLPTTTATPASTTSALPASSDQKQESDANPTSMPLAVKIGMGFGIGLGAPLLITAGVLIGIRMKRRHNSSTLEQISYDTRPAYDLPRYQEPMPMYHQIDGRSKHVSVYQLNDYGKTPRMSTRAELG